MKEPPVQRAVLDESQRAAVRIGKYGFRPALVDDGAEPPGDFVERLFPAHRSKPPLSLGSDAAHRRKQPVGMIRAIEIAVDLGTEKTLRHRMRRVPLDAHGAPVLDGHQGGAGIRAVVRAGATHLARGEKFG